MLQIVVNAFRWRDADALLLRPEDRLWSIYHSYYPQDHWWQRFKPDELEMETLVRDLKKDAPVEIAIDLHADVTLAELVRWVSGACMTSDEVVAALTANVGKRVRLTFDDGVTQSVDVGSVDDEGVLHSGPEGAEPNGYWTRFENVVLVESGND